MGSSEALKNARSHRSPCTCLRASRQGGDRPGVRSAATELQTNLADALAIVPWIAAEGDRVYQRAAVPWLSWSASDRALIGLRG
jgi:hypothetical protein